jgi:hypothetical protein
MDEDEVRGNEMKKGEGRDGGRVREEGHRLLVAFVAMETP